MYLDSLNKSECCGCEACVQICPKKCIRMVKDEFHFEYPQIDADQCIHCNLCKTVCPYTHAYEKKHETEVISGYASDSLIRDTGSSGGFQYVISRRFIENGGVVFGAVIDKNIVHHQCVTTVDELHRICKSKYVKSSTTGVFKEVQAYLKQGKKVLFTGTPCQVNALKAFLRKDEPGLYTLDFFCHGVASQDMFTRFWDYLGKKHDGQMEEYTFRFKKHDGLKFPHRYQIKLNKNGKLVTKDGPWFDDPYYVAYRQYRFYQKSCTGCRFNSSERVSDITLSDFWKGQQYYANQKISDGISTVMMNSEKAYELLSEEMLNTYFVYQKHDTSILKNVGGWGKRNKESHHEEILKEFWSSEMDGFVSKHLQFSVIKKLKVAVMYNTPLFVIHLKNRIGKLLHGKRV